MEKTKDECPLKPYQLVYVLNLMRDTKINANAAKIVLEDMYKNPADIHGYAGAWNFLHLKLKQ